MKITDLPLISSKDNSRLKRVRAVRDGRDSDALFVEGVRLAAELVRSPLKALTVFVSDDSLDKNRELINELTRHSAPGIHIVSSKVFDSIADTESSQGVIVIAERPDRQQLQLPATDIGLFVYLIKINNPSNLGAVVRTAEAAGAGGVITSPGSTDIYSPKALRASMGSAFRVPIFTDVSFVEAVEVARRSNVRVVAADVGSNQSYIEAGWRGRRMLVLGSEAHGLHSTELELVDETILIPMENEVESLNLAVSAGIIMFEAKRQRDEIKD